MKKYLTLFSIIFSSLLLLTACSEKNEEYYLTHLEEAKKDLEACQGKAMEAYFKKGKTASEEYFNEHCSAASNAVKKNEIAIYAKKLPEQYSDSSLSTLLNAYDSVCGRFSEEKEKCAAFKEFLEQKVESFDLEAYYSSLSEICDYNETNCRVGVKFMRTKLEKEFDNMSDIERARKVLIIQDKALQDFFISMSYEKIKQRKELYKTDKNLLKNDFNTCVDERSHLKMSENPQDKLISENLEQFGNYCRSSYEFRKDNEPSFNNSFTTKME